MYALSKKKLPHVAIFGAALGLSAFILLTTQVFLDSARKETLDSSSQALVSQALVLASETDRSFKTLDLLLSGIVDHIARLGVSRAEQFDRELAGEQTYRYLANQAAVLQQVDAITLVAANGKLINFSRSWPIPEVNVSERDYFKVLSNDPTLETYVSEPVQNKANNVWTIYLARRLSTPDGDLLGLVLGAIRLNYFEGFYQAVARQRGSAVALYRNDGILLARYPRGSNTGTLEALRFGDHDTATIRTSEKLANFPLTIETRLEKESALSGWNSLARLSRWMAFGGTILVLLIASLGCAWLARQGRLAEMVRKQHDRFDAALKCMPQGLSMFDGNDCLVAFNQQYLNVYGLSPDAVSAGMKFEDVFAGQTLVPDLRQYLSEFKKRIAGLGYTNNTVSFPDGRVIYISYAVTPDGGWVATHEDITQRKAFEQRIEQLAHFDGLTGLANRNLFKDRLEDELARLSRVPAEFAVMLLDLDKFKGVNDALGHQAGDALLQQVSERIRATVREVDFTARLGGDEFALIALGAPGFSRDTVAALATRLVDTLSTPYEIDGHPVVIGCSIGIALVPEQGQRSDEILRKADLALYESKNNGRNCFNFYSESLKAKADQRNILEIELREAIWREEIEVFYQPIVDLMTGRIRAVEALARWRHTKLGFIPPAEFIPIAEEAGLIVDLGNLVLMRACHDASRMPDGISVSVNLSAVQFGKSNVTDSVICALVDSGLQEGRLILEITESVFLSDNDQNLKTLNELKKLGVTIALDDFGAGYSSLSYLTAFSFDKVKIDKSFVDRLDRTETVAVVASIVQLGRSLNLEIVAEGLEKIDQVERVRSLGVPLGQGYFFGKPVPLADLNFEICAVSLEREVA